VAGHDGRDAFGVPVAYVGCGAGIADGRAGNGLTHAQRALSERTLAFGTDFAFGWSMAELGVLTVSAMEQRDGTVWPRSNRSAAQGWQRALELTSRLTEQPHRTLPIVIDELADRFGDAPALFSEGERLSFSGLSERSRRYARWALDHGVTCGETVCLLMPNCPEYMAIWLGITRVGGVVALLNTNLFGSSLAHCIGVVEPRHVIVAASLMDVFGSAVPYLKSPPRVWAHGDDRGHDGSSRLDVIVDRYRDEGRVLPRFQPATLSDRALCIYTSGTTGLPKAANVSHHRVMTWSYWFAGMMGTGPDDRMYNCLPMYHSIGGVVATGSVLVSGGSVAIRDRFSAQRFWDDVVKWDCSLVQYIGELCRYLLRAPPTPAETRHRLRLCCGNGLRLEVWEAFKHRFRIPQILEFYAATEGSFSLYNAEGRPGSIGRIPAFLAHRFPAALVKFDPNRGEPARDANGFCIRCARNEVGEAIGRIDNHGPRPGGSFEGYSSRAESEKKILRNVFAAGDAWFRTGDLMRQDPQGFYYFIDRVGDTFRWKGENVATAEVAEAISSCPGVIEAVVYGVSIPGADGRAGMAALVVDPMFDLAELHTHLVDRLPAYARPRFLRLCREIELTATFKQKRDELARDGFDPAEIDDPLYFDDLQLEAYVAMDRALFARIASGAERV
jgi:fatty-acyl-CoA synthase